MRHKILLIIAIVLGTWLAVLGMRHLILDGAYPVNITPHSIEEQIVQAVASKQAMDNSSAPTDEESPQVTNITYFADKQWAVADLAPATEGGQETTVVMKHEQNHYVLALGPGSDFPADIIDALQAPAELADYLLERGEE